MRSVYDAIQFTALLISSAAVLSVQNGTDSTSAAVDTKGYNSAVLVGHGDAAATNTTFTASFNLLECATSGGSYTAANDNSGAQIGFTLNLHTVAADGLARIEGLGQNRKRYLKVEITAASTGGSTPTANVFGYIAFGRAYELPANTAVSNT